MSELGDLLELIYGARERWRTARLTVRQWHHVERQGRAIERLNARRGGGGGAQVVRLYGEASGPEPTDVEHVVRVWLEDGRAREEREGPFAFPALAIRDGERWWQYSPEHGASSNEGDPGVQSGIGEAALTLLDPAHVLGALRLERTGDVEIAGRPGLRLSGLARDAGGGGDFALHRLGIGADEYELVVDRECGVLLRTAALLDGLELTVNEILELALDETFPPETFVFTLPEGESFRPLFHHPEHTTLERAAALAPFTVLAPTRVPDGWQLHVLFLPGDDRPPLPPSVDLHYHSRDAAHQLHVHQTAADEAEPQEWLRWEPRGDLLVAAGAREPRGLEPVYVRAERHGTRATLSSADLELDALARLAESLAPAATEPPSL